MMRRIGNTAWGMGLGVLLACVIGCSAPTEDATPAQTEPESAAAQPVSEPEPTAPAPASTPAPDPNIVLAGISVATDTGAIPLDEGAVLIAVLNATCDHCKTAVPLLNELMIAIPDTPFAGLVLGEEAEIASFDVTTEPLFPYEQTTREVFYRLIDTYPPRLVLAYDGAIATTWHWRTPAEFPTVDTVLQAINAASGS